MDWLRAIGEEGLLGVSPTWIPFLGYVLLLLTLAAAETVSPLHRQTNRSQQRLMANFGLGIANMLIIAALPVSTVLAAEWSHRESLGLLHWLSPSPAAAFGVTFLLVSLAAYVLHVLSHRIPLLWRMHQVHHSDVEIDLSTGVRHHPFEVLFQLTVLCAIAVLLGLSPAAVALYSIVSGLFALWTHANLRVPKGLERAMGLAMVTPAIHNVHHSAAQVETDTNYGDMLIVWDRLFGTYHPMPQHEVRRIRHGLGDAHEAGAGNIAAQLRAPFARLGQA